MRNKNNKGFTLIELLVVIAIIGLLASVVLLALNGARAKSRDAKRIADVRQMASALEIFYNDFNSYPTGANTNYLVPTYIGQTPVAPVPVDNASGSTVCTSGTNAYNYFSSNTAAGGSVATYTYSFCLGGLTGGFQPGVHTLSQIGIQ